MEILKAKYGPRNGVWFGKDRLKGNISPFFIGIHVVRDVFRAVLRAHLRRGSKSIFGMITDVIIFNCVVNSQLWPRRPLLFILPLDRLGEEITGGLDCVGLRNIIDTSFVVSDDLDYVSWRWDNYGSF